MKTVFQFLVLSIMLTAISSADSVCDLSGVWRCALDSEDQGLVVGMFAESQPFPEKIRLPGTTDLAGLGLRVEKAAPYGYHLTREFSFNGPAWYAREIVIPEDWKGREVEVFLERVMWQSRVWVDGVEEGMPQDSLCTPHRHPLGSLVPGKHKLVIRVDNRMIHPIGDKGHAFGDQTQSAWNGIVGRIELHAKPSERLESIRVFPSLDGTVKVEVSGWSCSTRSLRLKCGSQEVSAPAPDGHFTAKMELSVRGEIRHWSEFDPHIDQVDVEMAAEDGTLLDRKRVDFGFREVKTVENQLLINGRPAFMRGNLECAVFPKTGHPPVDVESWRKIWRVYREHGMNHARFHSWCPPEAAFVAADQLGIYLQVEAPFWMDRWMAGPNNRPEMDTVGYPKGLGRADRGNDAFAQAEILRILDTYGNHPSFVFFCLGNELGTSDFEVTGLWMRDAKAHDPRHLYAASTARTITPFCDFSATHLVPGIGGVRQHLEFGTGWDYETQYALTPVPIIAHEIGQWPVYPDWTRELAEYTGPLKPFRLEEFAKMSASSGVDADVAAMHSASGAANRLLYRDEIESFLRTPSCRGFQLLGMQDFTGQGEAMVGWLDPFYQSKGTTSPEEFRRYCGPVVPLLKLPAYVFRKSEHPEVEALLHHYGPDEMDSQSLSWSLADAQGKVVDSGHLKPGDFPAGGVHEAGRFALDFQNVDAPARLNLTIAVDGRNLSNKYSVWVYPNPSDDSADGGVVMTGDWEGVARPALNEGRKVVLLANTLGGRHAAKLAQWMPLYWSVPFFPGQNRETLGLAVDAAHPVFDGFPTEGFGDWNWFRICQGAHGFDLMDILPPGFRPMVRPVTDFHLNRRLGSIFEVRVGKGSLLVCGYNLREDRSSRFPEVAQLRRSLLGYAASSDFAPGSSVEASVLDALFADPEHARAILPERFKDAELYVSAAHRVEAGRSDWCKEADAVLRKVDGVDYAVTADGTWRDDQGCAWFGKTMKIVITPRAGVPGKVLVRFHDWNHLDRRGMLDFEGHEFPLFAHADGRWVEFPFIREDTNDGRLVLSVKTLAGPNLMITDIALVPGE